MTSINMMFFMGGPQLGELEAGSLGGSDRRAAFGRDWWTGFTFLRGHCGGEVEEFDGVSRSQ